MSTFFAWFVVAEPQLIKPKDVMTEIANIRTAMRSCILDDPYDRETLKNIYTAMRLQF
jgi:ribosome recycling factor